MPTLNTAISSHRATSGEHTTHYLAAGPEDGPLIIFVHGWPELSISWRHQLPAFASLGFRAVAPDMRGYGASTVYDRHEDYAQQHVVGDMLLLLTALGRERAIWVGHDWGSPTVWNIASHHPERCDAVASLCVPYFTLERGLDACLGLVDRAVYPAGTFPAGQWEYQLFYQEQFDRATSIFQANVYNTAKLLFRKGDPAGKGQPAGTAMTRINNGWFGALNEAPDVPRDDDVVTEEDLQTYAAALQRNGFFGPDSYYMNHDTNAAFAARAVNAGRLDMPVLFLHAEYDYVCETVSSRLAEPMRAHCSRLDEAVISSGHWMAQEQPTKVNAALARWLVAIEPLGAVSRPRWL